MWIWRTTCSLRNRVTNRLNGSLCVPEKPERKRDRSRCRNETAKAVCEDKPITISWTPCGVGKFLSYFVRTFCMLTFSFTTHIHIRLRTEFMREGGCMKKKIKVCTLGAVLCGICILSIPKIPKTDSHSDKVENAEECCVVPEYRLMIITRMI